MMRSRPALAAAMIATLLLGACSSSSSGGHKNHKKQSSSSSQASTASAAAPTPTGGKTNPLGFKWDAARVAQYRPYLRSVSGGATFTEVGWCDIEPRPGAQSWSAVDDIVHAAADVGQRIYLKLRVGSCWVNGNGGGAARGVKRRKTASAMPTDLAAYRGFVREALRRYPAVDEFAVENEVNSPSSWSSSSAEYRTLVETAAAEIHADRPGARVFDGGTSSVGYGVAIVNDKLAAGDDAGAVAAYNRYYERRVGTRNEFPTISGVADLRSLLATDEFQRHLEYFNLAIALAHAHVTDGLQIHYYETAAAVPDVTALLQSRLGARVPIEAWELGLFWPAAPGDAAVVSEGVRSAAEFLGAGVRQVIWLPMAYNPSGRHATEIRIGIANPDGSSRPLGSALARLASAGTHGAPRAVTAAGLKGVVFGPDAGGQVAAVVWSTARAPLPTVAGVTAVDSLGEHAGALGVDPVFLTGPAALAGALRG